MKPLCAKLFALFLLFPFFSPAQIQLGWLNTLTTSGHVEKVWDLAIDQNSNLYSIGNFNGPLDMDPGPGSHILTPAGSHDAFINKTDINGNFIWAKRIGSTGNDFFSNIKSDNSANLYMAGTFEGTVDFDPGPGVHNATGGGTNNMFVLKLDQNGNFQWVYTMSGNDWNRINELAIAPTG